MQGVKCSICNDSKFVPTSRDNTVTRCQCYWEEYARSINHGFSLETLESLLEKKYPTRVSEIMASAKEIFEYPLMPGYGIWIKGVPGVGKTILARIIASTPEMIRKCPVIHSEKEIADIFVSHARGLNINEYRKLWEAGVLVIDDFGSLAEPTPYFMTSLIHYLDRSKFEVSLVVTSNYGLNGLIEMNRHDPRLIDRLRMQEFVLRGQSLRGT